MVSCEKLLPLYELIIVRHKEEIEEKEEKTITEIREMIKPYDEFVKKKLKEILGDVWENYERERDFLVAVKKIADYIKEIETVEVPVTFWMKFEEMDTLKVGNKESKGVYLTTLLRALGGENVLLYMTEKGNFYVGFEWKGLNYFINPDNGRFYFGEEITKLLEEEKPQYALSDLTFESFE